MRLSLHQPRFNLSLDGGLVDTPVYVHNDYSPIIGLVICYLSVLILNPFLAIFILSLFSLFIKGYSKSILLMFVFALAIFYSSRNFGVTWASGDDDALQYLLNYHSSLKNSLADIFREFYVIGSKVEPLYYSFWWIIGKLFNPEPMTFFFLIYLSQVTLLSIVAYLVSRRYAIIFIFVFYFGITNPNTQILHLWRASFAFLIFLIGIVKYFKGNKKTGRILVYLSFGFHVSILVNICIFEVYNFLKKRKKYGFVPTVALGAIIVWLTSSFFEMVALEIFPNLGHQFTYTINDHLGMARLVVYAVVLITLVAANYYYKLSAVGQFAAFCFSMYLIILLHFGLNNPIMTRLLTIMVPIVGIALFEIVMKQPRVLIVFIISFLYLHTIIQPVSDMLFQMLPEYRDPFYGVLNILF